MYPVSNSFLAAVYNDAAETNLTGTIGSATFTKNNIVAGSFHISNQCTDTSDITLGSVFLGQLTCTFVDVEIAYTNWIGKDITPTFSLKVGENAWESVPLGVFRVMEAKHTAEGVAVTAYDNMRKFDRKIKKAHFRNVEANLHTFVTTMCTDCNVTFGMTQEEFFELPNSSETTFVFGYTNETKKYSNDIETYRDLLFYVAQTLGCFATIDRNGQLVFRKYKSNVAETISDRQRLSGAQFADYITNYTGIYVTNMRDESDSYYGYDYELINTEINLCNQELEQIESDLVELQRQYDEHEITEEEYLAQKKVLETERKQVNKRLNWLYKARDKAQAGEEGTFMDLGSNPFLQSGNSTKRERMRRRVLKALDPISYTPFTCDSVIGVHYDLGDVIYFTGGHAGSDGVFCCLMAFDWTYNAEYQMQGFGVDPSILNIKDRNAKAAKEANANAMGAYEISSGTLSPLDTDGKADDIYIKYAEKVSYTAMYPIEYYGPADDVNWDKTGTPGIASLKDFEFDDQTGTYSFTVSGRLYGSELPNGYTGDPVLKVGLDNDSTAQYKIVCDASWETTGGYAVAIPGLSAFTNSNSTNPGSPPGTSGDTRRFTEGSTSTHYEFTGENAGPVDYAETIYMWVNYWFPFAPSGGTGTVTIHVSGLRIERIIDPGTGETDGGLIENREKYIDAVYVKQEDEATGVESWKEIEYVAGIDDSEHSGLELDYKRYLHLTPEVMRAWIKADPPQAKQTCNRYCIRYTGKPDTALNITLHSNTGWLNKSIKKDSEGVFTVKSAGTVSSGNIEYCVYAISGFVTGQRYYFNLKCNFKDGTTFNKDYTKGLGLVFNTTGVIDTDNWTGDPNTFDAEHLYYSMPRKTSAFFANFDFIATASTMYMCVVVADIADGESSSLTLSRFVISKTKKAYIRNFYMFDLEQNDWLQYKPWGSGDEGGEGGASSLADLDDVNLDNIQNGQSLYYNSATGEWSNGDMPIASANSVGGIKVGANLSIDANGVLSATGGASDVELVELTQAEYDQLTPEQKADPNVIYFITDAGGSGGGGGGTTVIANPTGTPTDQLDTVQIGNTIYEIVGGGGSYSQTVIYSNSGTSVSDIELTNAYTNYDSLYFECIRTADNRSYVVPYYLLAESITNIGHFQLFGYNEYCSYDVTDSTHFTKVNNNGNWYIKKIYGVKH